MLNGNWTGFDCDPAAAGYHPGFAEAYADRWRLFERALHTPPGVIVLFVPEERRAEVQAAIVELLNGPVDQPGQSGQPGGRPAPESDVPDLGRGVRPGGDSARENGSFQRNGET
jgi:hypothetical protein